MHLLLNSDTAIESMQTYQYHLGILSMLVTFVLKSVCFVIGYFTIKLGHDLIKSGVKGEFKFTSEIKGFKGGLASSSPGLLFVLLGIGIVGYAMFVEKRVKVGTAIENSKQSTATSNDSIIIPQTLTDTLP